MITEFTDYDSYLFHNGTNYELYQKMGAHPCLLEGQEGTLFFVWAPNAAAVSVITSETGWSAETGRMEPVRNGVWGKFLPGVSAGALYRFRVTGADGAVRDKSDPFAFFTQKRPENASVVTAPSAYCWKDREYTEKISEDAPEEKPMSIYELHPGSWKKEKQSFTEKSDGFLNYRELADSLSEYCGFMGYTHVELIGICEHPFDGSWGYQVTGYFSPTSRYGTPEDFRYFVDKMHASGIGVILDWVPAHFPKDSFSLSLFDGTCLFESSDPYLREFPQWGTFAFDHAKPEVRSFLISSALYWLREFHIDALRVDAVASMMYLDFGREHFPAEKYGGNENRAGISFLQQLNEAVRNYSSGYLIAEDSSIRSGMTRPVGEGGIGFRFKWNMGWMNDTLSYLKTDPVYRQYLHDKITGTVAYSFLESYILVISHDEVVHLKRSMLSKIPGNEADRKGCLKAFYTYMFLHPGKKLLFMGQDFGQEREWDEKQEPDWYLADERFHREILLTVRKLNRLYRNLPCLYTDTGDSRTFSWIRKDDSGRNILSFLRRNPWNFDGAVLAVINFSPVPYPDYCVGTPVPGKYPVIFSTSEITEEQNGENASAEDGMLSGKGPAEEPNRRIEAEPLPCDGHPYRLTFSLRPYEAVLFSFPC